ncbi:unnamed protein product [Gongylonema pulchrum]|uniref:Seryl_tRNA_N domain-containing protein n=1 Tax=Gongylonema pulchrum TaxID=637853 RepID=A0A183EPK8_9BILA|nr:unnamed protein product [Gongylonema pulchrum]
MSSIIITATQYSIEQSIRKSLFPLLGHLWWEIRSTRGALQTAAAVKAPIPEKEKKMRALQKKLTDIEKLKARKESGEQLEANQLSKIEREEEIIEELEKLKLS